MSETHNVRDRVECSRCLLFTVKAMPDVQLSTYALKCREVQGQILRVYTSHGKVATQSGQQNDASPPEVRRITVRPTIATWPQKFKSVTAKDLSPHISITIQDRLISYNGSPVKNSILRVQWSRDRWRQETPKGLRLHISITASGVYIAKSLRNM